MSKAEAAFPHSDGAFGGTHHGMSLRDWFAGQALAGIMFRGGISPKFAARDAYEYADAMIAARGQS